MSTDSINVFHRRTGLGLTTSSDDHRIEEWFRSENPQKILETIVDAIAGGGEQMRWTGFRILGTVGGNGYAIWSVELIAKSPRVNTPVFDTENAPNLRPHAPRKYGLF